ncbi:UNVERIFIED_CONTAM: hypothetical protein GTU68_019078 [Idotea baltica]|nr:hypothetical protein [Idotea baltica]
MSVLVFDQEPTDCPSSQAHWRATLSMPVLPLYRY